MDSTDSKKSDHRSYIIKIALSILLFVVLLYFIGIDKILQVLANAKPEFIVAAVCCYVLMNFAMSYRIKIVLDEVGDRLSVFKIYPSSLAGLLASDVTPARSGYFFTAFSLTSKFEIPLEKTMVAIFGPQIFDFLIKVFSAFVLFYIILQTAGIGNVIYSLIILVGFLGAVVGAALLVFYPPFMKLFSFLRVIPFVPVVFDFLSKMHDHSASVLKIKGKVILVTLVSWFLKGLEWFFLSKAIGISISNNPFYEIAFMMIFQGAVTITQFLPIPTVAGAGASEASFVVILALFNISFAASVTFALLTRFLVLFVDLFSLPTLLDYLHKTKNSLESISIPHF